MEDKKKAAIPEMTNDQKLRVVLAHREYIKADNAAATAEQRKRVALQTLTTTVDEVGMEMGVEKDRYTINLDALTLLPVEKR